MILFIWAINIVEIHKEMMTLQGRKKHSYHLWQKNRKKKEGLNGVSFGTGPFCVCNICEGNVLSHFPITMNVALLTHPHGCPTWHSLSYVALMSYVAPLYTLFFSTYQIVLWIRLQIWKCGMHFPYHLIMWIAILFHLKKNERKRKRNE